MVQAVKITSLNDIGTGIMYTTLVPVVNMTGIPTTEKANLQIVGNLILTGAGGSYFPPAAQATVSQYVAYAAQPNITSVGTLTSLAVTGNITAGNANLGNLAIANVFSGTLNGSAVSANTANTVVANAQPNITSVGTLTSLNVTGLANLGAVTSLTITGGSPNYVLKTDGFGTLSWVAQSGGGSGNTGNITFSAANISTDLLNTDIQIIGNGTGDVNVVANSQVWTFNADGNLTIPNAHGNIGTLYNNGIDIIAPIGGYAELASGNLDNFIYVEDSGAYINTNRDTGSGYQWEFDQTGNLTTPGNIFLAIAAPDSSIGSASNVNINAGNSTWSFVAYGNLVLSDGGILWNNYGLTTLQAASDGAQIGSNDGQSYVIANANGTYMQTLADTTNYLWNFDTTGNLILPGNTFSVNYANGDPVQIGGGGNANTGNITFSAANISTDLLNTDINIIGNGTGDVNVVANSQVWTFGADGNLTIPNAHGNIGSVYNNGIDIVAPIGGYAELASGNLNNFIYVQDQGAYVNTDRNGADYQWLFDTTGNLILPDTSSIIAAAGISIQANSTGNTTGLGLNGDADAFLYAHANIIINTDVNGTGNTWIFGTDGTTQFPGNTILVPEGKPLEIKTTDGNVYSTLTTDASGGYASVGLQDNNTGANPAWAYVETDMSDVNDPSAVVILKPGDTGTEVRWTFTADGNLTTPGNIMVDVAGDAIIGSSSNVNVSAGGNTWTFGTDGVLQVPSNATAAGPGTIASANGYPTLIAYGSGGSGFGIHGGPELDWMNADDPANSFSNSSVLRHTAFLNATGFYIGMNENHVVGNTTANWLFTPSGNLRLPDNGLIWNNGGLTTLQAGTDAAQIGSNDGQSYVIANANGTYMQTLADTTNSLWHFGTDGNLTLPVGGTISDFDAGPPNSTGTSLNGIDYSQLYWNGNIGNGNPYDGSDLYTWAYVDANGFHITHYDDGNSINNIWNFTATGNTSFPAVGTANLGNLAIANNFSTNGSGGDITLTGGNITGANVIAANTFLGTGNLHLQPNPANTDAYLDVYLTTGPDIHIVGNGENLILGRDAGANVMLGVDGNVTIQANTGTPHIWTFGSDGNLTLPYGAVIKDTVTAAVAFGDGAGANTQGAYSVAVGAGAGANTQGTYAVAVGSNAGAETQGNLAVAIGYSAGVDTQGEASIAIGQNAGQNTQGNNSVAIGYSAGVDTQGEASIAIGQNAGNTTQGNSAVAIGVYAGQTNQGDDTVAIGDGAGQTGQKEDAVAIGQNAGQTGQGISSVAIGYGAGFTDQGNQSVAIGENAGANQGSTAVAIGQNAGGGVAYQNDDAVAIGHSAGEEDQGTQAIAIGLYTGQVAQGLNSIALGAYAGQTNQGNNSIILNATGNPLDQTVANTFTVSPVRNDTSNIAEVMFYNTTSKEVTYGNTISVAGNITGAYVLGNGSQLTGISTSFAGEMHVSKDGNDITGTGTILRPYLTITHALTQVAGGRNTIVIHPGEYTENPTITSTNTQLITYDTTGASTIVIGTVTMANVDSRIAGLRMANLIIAGNSQAYISTSTVTGQFTKSSSGYVEVDDCELQVTGNVLISGSGSISIIGNKINNLVVNNAGATVLVKGADDCVMPQVTAGSLNIVDSIIRASSNTANAVTASAGTVVTLMNNQIVTPAADNVARVSIAGYHSIISLVYDKANSTLSNSLNSVAYFQTANVDSLVSSGNITGAYFIGNGSQLTDVGVASVPSQNILPTIQSITIAATSNGGTGGGSGWANVTVANTIPVTEYGVIVTAGTISQKYVTGSLGSIPGTVQLSITTGLNTTPFTVYAYVTSNAGTYYSNSATGTSGICLLAGTQIALSDGSYKAIEDITYTDKMLSWDFDRGCYAETSALWIKRGETGSQYNLLTFSDGTTLRTFDQHRIFNKQAGAFTYPMTDTTPIGTITVNEHGKEITLTNKQVIQDTIEYYNVITDYHMNLFSDSVLTSCRFNNIYPITDMKFVKDARILRTRDEFENVEYRFFNGLRLAEQTTDIETVEWYVNRLLSTEVLAQSELTV